MHLSSVRSKLRPLPSNSCNRPTEIDTPQRFLTNFYLSSSPRIACFCASASPTVRASASPTVREGSVRWCPMLLSTLSTMDASQSVANGLPLRWENRFETCISISLSGFRDRQWGRAIRMLSVHLCMTFLRRANLQSTYRWKDRWGLATWIASNFQNPSPYCPTKNNTSPSRGMPMSNLRRDWCRCRTNWSPSWNLVCRCDTLPVNKNIWAGFIKLFRCSGWYQRAPITNPQRKDE